MTLTPEPGKIVARLVDAARAIVAPLVGPGFMPGDPGGGSLQILAIGWATVELDRAAAELGASLDLPADAWTPADRDQLLGAAALLGPPLPPDAQGPRLILLEPDTEGRLAASLARGGEGVAAIYVVDTVPGTFAPGAGSERRGGPPISAPAPGPLGRARLVLGGQVWGPHVVVLDTPTNPESLPSARD